MAKRKTCFTCWRLWFYGGKSKTFTQKSHKHLFIVSRNVMLSYKNIRKSVEIACVGAFLSVQTGARSSNREKHRRRISTAPKLFHTSMGTFISISNIYVSSGGCADQSFICPILAPQVLNQGDGGTCVLVCYLTKVPCVFKVDFFWCEC